MEKDLEYDVFYVPEKKNRHFHYEMKLLNNKNKTVVHVRKSKKGGASIAKLIDDALYLFINGAWNVDELARENNIEKVIEVQEKYYNESIKIYGFPLAGWSPEMVQKVREYVKETKNK